MGDALVQEQRQAVLLRQRQLVLEPQELFVFVWESLAAIDTGFSDAGYERLGGVFSAIEGEDFLDAGSGNGGSDQSAGPTGSVVVCVVRVDAHAGTYVDGRWWGRVQEAIEEFCFS